MKLQKLYIFDFMCYDHGFVDFTDFSAALIIGKKDNNEHFANGVGKTTIFKAIEYCLFNYSDTSLERLIRDDTTACQVVLDFLIGDQEYRLSRIRSKKSTDLTLLQRNSQFGSEEQVYHQIVENRCKPYIDKKDVVSYWKDLSGSRAGDTERDLAKLIKINQKAFRSTALFPQNDISGLSTATPEKRKGILKEALNLAVYTKLEKIAKDQAALLSKDIDKHKVLLEHIADPSQEISNLSSALIVSEQSLIVSAQQITALQLKTENQSKNVNELINSLGNMENQISTLLSTEKSQTQEKNRAETSVKEYNTKKANVAKVAQDILLEITLCKEIQEKLSKLDFSQIEALSTVIEKNKELITQNNMSIKLAKESLEELKIPLPSGSICKNCRKPMTDADRQQHQQHIDSEISKYERCIQDAQEKTSALIIKNQDHNKTIISLKDSKQQLDQQLSLIESKKKEIQEKHSLHKEYSNLLIKFKEELAEKNKELSLTLFAIKNSSVEEVNLLKDKIQVERKKLVSLENQLSELNRLITQQSNEKAVLQHNLENKTAEKIKKEELLASLSVLENKFSAYPSVIQAFSSGGIPNLIIQNILDDLQIESNNLLSQIKPGIQLSFLVEKTIEKTGEPTDTLDINYTINGKDRYYEQLSGAQQLAVAFSLKLGLSFLLQKMVGTDIKFLLLDEIDPSLDKASVDAFADIVKHFQKEYTILIITHNDRLKDKFSYAILVEQDNNMISTAKVVSSW